MTAFTTDSYGVDERCAQTGNSRFTQILVDADIPEDDRDAVALYAGFIRNTWIGARPSDAARRAVKEYRANPERIRNRESGCAA